MNKTKRICALLLCLMLCAAMFAACANDASKQTESADATYKVTVVDGLGNPYSEKIIVKFIQAGKQVAMAPIRADGTVEKTLARGDYSIELDATGDSEYYFDASSAKLTADKTETQVIMAYVPTETGEIGVDTGEVDEEGNAIYYQAGKVSLGSSYVTLDAAERSYFLFTPTEAGSYQFSTVGGSVTIGYYGSPYFVQSQNVGDVENNILTISVSAGMVGSGNTGTSVFVIGIDAENGTSNTILNVARVGDPAWSIADEPWSVYQLKQAAVDFTLPVGTKLTDFDITASADTYVLVFNEQDRCYHLGTADGPAVYVNLEKAVYGISMLNMVGEIIYEENGTPIESGTSPFRYVKNNGRDDFFKEDYTDAVRQIITARDDKTGVYPLTEDLYYILKMGIDAMGWTQKGTMNYLFADEPSVNEDLAWMFLYCYANA